MPLWPPDVRQIFQIFFTSKFFMTLYYCITSFFGAPHFVLWTHCICTKFFQIRALFTCFLLGAASLLFQMMLIKASIMELRPALVVCVCTCLKIYDIYASVTGVLEKLEMSSTNVHVIEHIICIWLDFDSGAAFWP